MLTYKIEKMNFLFNRDEPNVLISILQLLRVKHTKIFASKLYNEHPYKYCLFGLSKMLSDYGIQNAGVKIRNKETDIFNIVTPFVAHMESDFISVYRVDPDKIHYIRNGKNVSTSPEEFCSSWSGIVLLAESDSNSSEPNYKDNKIEEVFNYLEKSILICITCAIIVFVYIVNKLYNGEGLTIELIVNFVGLYISYLLIQKQMHIHNKYADKICFLFKKSDCKNVLESKAAKFLGLIGWSEVGFSYFISNAFIILFLPHLVFFSTIVNICALPYSIWSVWYQKFKAKQWCTLCLVVQILLWSIFFLNLVFGFTIITKLNFSNLFLFGCVYLVPFFLINILISKLSGGEKIEEIKQEINSIKSNKEVFITLLKQQSYYQVDIFTSKIIFGNPHANILVTILTNPHCQPCARMHKQIERYLETGNNNLCIQYIFTSFKRLDYSSKFLISLYLCTNNDFTKKVFHDWFEGEESIFYLNKDRDNDTTSQLFKKWFGNKLIKYNIDQQITLNSEERNNKDEFEKHKAWISKTKLQGTPTILINGYKLPENYKIEDLKYFSTLDLDLNSN